MSDFPANDADDLEIKKRARRRLVGAAALALLAAAVLLLVMDREAPPTVPDMEVSIRGRGESPQAAAGPDSGSVQVDAGPDAAPGAPGFAAGTPVVEPDSVPAPLSAAAPLPGSAMPPEQPVSVPPVASSTVSSSPASNVPPSAAPAREDARRPRAAENDEAARVLALLDGNASGREATRARETASGKDKSRNRVFIQVGAFGNAARAAALAGELKKQDFAAYAEKAGKVTRVRIGPLSRSDAEQVISRLKAQRYDAKLMSR